MSSIDLLESKLSTLLSKLATLEVNKLSFNSKFPDGIDVGGGTAGPQGNIGPQGPQGPQGDIGPQGLNPGGTVTVLPSTESLDLARILIVLEKIIDYLDTTVTNLNNTYDVLNR